MFASNLFTKNLIEIGIDNRFEEKILYSNGECKLENDSSAGFLSTNIFQYDLQKQDFYLNCRVDEWFYIVRKNCKIKINIPKGKGEERNIIYIFENVIKNKFLIGETEQTFRQRMSDYIYDIENNLALEEFIGDLKEHPNAFKVGILYRTKPDEDIKKVEKQFIKAYKAAGKPVYNINNGGGGGHAASKEIPSWYAIPVTNGFPSPIKSYQVKRVEGKKLTLDSSPGLKQLIQEKIQEAWKEGDVFAVAYRYKKRGIKSEEGPSRKRKKICKESSDEIQIDDNISTRYVGITDGPARVRSHCTSAAATSSNGSNGFYKDLRSYPEQFEAGVIPLKYINPASISDEEKENYRFFTNLKDVEDYLIETAKKEGKVYNTNGGGGGPRAGSVCRKPPQSKKIFK